MKKCKISGLKNALLSKKNRQILSKFWKINYRKIAKFRRLRSREECKSCRSRKMLQNASLLAIVAVDTEENEPIKNEVWWVRRHFWGASAPPPRRGARARGAAAPRPSGSAARLSPGPAFDLLESLSSNLANSQVWL